MNLDNAVIFLKKNIVEILIVSFCLVFGTWLMFSTFSYHNGSMLVASKAWSDFASHIPLIRSFSYGSNLPPQYPLFAGPPIHYHFLFFLFVGLLEKIGLRIDFALNLLSIIGFAGLLCISYFFAKKLFQSKAVGILTILFFILNGSLSFLYFFQKHPLSSTTPLDIVMNKSFVSFGPYDSGIVSAFWNMNIYTNQRHFAVALALSLVLIYFFIKPIISKTDPSKKTAITIGILFGLSFFLHMAIFLMSVVVIGCIFLFFPRLRISALIVLSIAAIIAYPQYQYVQTSGGFKLQIVPGYLIAENLTVFNFMKYWFYNFGLHLFFLPLGILLASKQNKKIFVSFFPLFIIGNLFQFSPEMAANHKFFNLFLLIGSMFSAYFLVWCWKKTLYYRPIVIVGVCLLIFSGVIDFFPIVNDSKMELVDYPVNTNIAWIMKHTSPSSVFLNTTYLYNPASLAGRKIFLGWPYFAWSAGYDTHTRGKIIERIITNTDKSNVCSLLRQNKIDFLEVINPSNPKPDIMPISHLFSNQFNLAYSNPNSQYYIYSVEQNCQNNL